ncbi:CRISPR-associated endonuclease/helicase Cas3 [Spinactinospora alkalitolerans]|uniref:CRISPR-associated endonuclease/helicase Cas3 n=1 Tax=Spinactinospora alkalitolerans TaxID=687207 RepID=A0A852U1H2_9ACTN|nr:CRISPR-associated helicase Cas3' [Spinactinospora alkalitolerans]NYE50706.1 CRISPR-associated endonuclease/helicase Cas3 [Spinactinospora alkalitolerans]
MSGNGEGIPTNWARAAWGKLGNGNTPHPLICHAIDTAVVAEALYDVVLGPYVREEIERGLAPLGSEKDRRAWTAVLSGLHDIGKLTPAFQAVRIDQAEKLLGEIAVGALRAVRPDPLLGRRETHHGLLSAVHMDGWLKGRKASWSARSALVDLLGGHHGWIVDPDEVKKATRAKRQLGGVRWARARDDLITEIARLWELDPHSEGWSDVSLSTAAAVGLAGLTILSDWTASSRPRREYTPEPGDLAEYRKREIGRVGETLNRVNWTPWRPPRNTSHAVLFPRDDRPRPLQERIRELLAGVDRPGILVVEAPTGEGKTKAGIQACAALVGRLGLGGMYVATPTRATAGPVHAEVNRVLKATGSPLRANLLYSGAAADLERQAQERRQAGSGDLDELSLLMPKDVGRECSDALKEARSTFTRKRALTFPIGVGTVDQALMAATRTGHVAMRLTSLSNKVLMIDEVHAYDAYMSRLLDRLLWWCGRLGVPVVLMSATLPAARREELTAAWKAGAATTPPAPAVDGAESSAWRLTWVDASGRRSVPVPVSADNPARRVSVQRIPDNYDVIADEVVRRLRDGGCAAVIHNTTRRATASHDRIARCLEGMEPRPELLYLDGKTDPDKRRALERRLERLCGPDSSGTRRAIVVGTQVLEHGIDADFDLVVTDPCPVDLLVQRAGRLHRHARVERPMAVADPLLLVVRSEKGFTFPPYTTAVYAESHLLATEYELSLRDAILLPKDIPELVHAVYADGDRIPQGRLRTRWEAARRKRSTREEMDRFESGTQCIPMLWDTDGLIRLTKRSVRPRVRKNSGRRDMEEHGGGAR